MAHSLKQLLQTDQLLRIFGIGRVVHPVVFDLFGIVGGYHAAWLDQEHCGLTYEQIVLAATCCRANGLDCFVRMPLVSYAHATQALEAGAGGLMAAWVRSADEAETFVRWAKFAPRGHRGLNAGGRDALYGGKPQPQFVADSNRDSLVIIQIETVEALRQADAIAAIDGVDMLFVGPSDMSQALGITGQFDHPRLWEAYQTVADACRNHGKHWATLGLNPSFAQRAVELGCRMLGFGSDVQVLRRGVEAYRETFAGFF